MAHSVQPSSPMTTSSDPTPRRALLVDEDAAGREQLGGWLASAGLEVTCTSRGAEALALLQRGDAELMVLDWSLGGELGAVALLGEVAARFPEVATLVVARGAGVDDAVQAVRAGAADFLERPSSQEEIALSVDRALALRASELDRAPPSPGLSRALIGRSKPMLDVQEKIRRAARSDATVLLRGESGTGKEVVARAIHERSARRSGPFVKVHCAALPDGLLESELFGHEKGAFTGAGARKPGRVEVAEGGTLFLDEIGDITAAMQVKLLRLLQDREYEMLGSTRSRSANVRFLAATHRDLEGMVKSGEFREDLFYRLQVVPLWLPPLRARRDDIVPLAEHFCRSYAEAAGNPKLRFSPEALEWLRRQRWAGNVRQLQNFVERLVVLCEAETLEVADIEAEHAERPGFSTESAGTALSRASLRLTGAGGASAESVAGEVPLLEQDLRDAERRALVRALRHTRGNRAQAARVLGISRATLYNKLAEHDLT